MVGALFCKFPSATVLEDTFWGLICPLQTQYVQLEEVRKFLEKLQAIAIDIPSKREQQRQDLDQQIIFYFKKLESAKASALEATIDQI